MDKRRNTTIYLMKTFEQRKFKRKETLGEYLKKRIKNNVPTADELDFYIQQYKVKSGHSEWSETYKRNFWVEDED